MLSVINKKKLCMLTINCVFNILISGPNVIGSMTGRGLSDTDSDDSELSDSGPSGLDLDDVGDEQGMGEQDDDDDDDDDALGSDDDF